MAQQLSGNQMLAFFRRYEDRFDIPASRYVFQTELTVTKEKNTEETTTVEGTQTTISGGTNEAEFTSIAYANDDQTITMWEDMEEWFDNEDIVEFWLVNLANMSDSGELRNVRYHRGFFTSFELSAPADGKVELSYSYAINNATKGDDMLDGGQIEVLNNFRYISMAQQEETAGTETTTTNYATLNPDTDAGAEGTVGETNPEVTTDTTTDIETDTTL